MDKKSNRSVKETTEIETVKAAPEVVEIDSVDKIRDILFGQQMREVGQTFANLENRLAKDLADMREENATQLESLKSYLESEIEILTSNLGSEEQTRIQQLDELDDKLKQSVKQSDKKFSDTQKSLDKNSSDLNQKILKQSQDFSADLTKQMANARDRMDGHKQELGKGKVDKVVLAEMLNTLAMQVSAGDSTK